jgi:hypothetical protein
MDLQLNPWSVLTIFIASCSNQVEWKDILGFYDQYRYALDYPTDSASRLSTYEWQPRALGHGWGSALHGTKVVAKHKQMHDHLASTLLQYPCRMHHNTHQTASQCRVEPTRGSGEDVTPSSKAKLGAHSMCAQESSLHTYRIKNGYRITNVTI